MKLYPLEPVVDGPWMRQGLWSYIAGLAEHHCVIVGDLIKEAIWPASGWPENKRRVIRGYDSIGFLEGAGQVAQDWVDVLQKLTGRNDLARLTFLSAATAFRLEGAARSRGARCIECLREMEYELDSCFDPLVWSLADYGICARHKTLQTDVCAQCKTTDLGIVRATSRIGCCGRCGVWMGSDVFKSESAGGSSRYGISISEALFDVVKLLDDRRLASVDGTRVMEYAGRIAFGSNFAEMAASIGMPKNTLSIQLSRRTKPRLHTVATLAVVTGIPVKHLLFGSINGRRVVSKVLNEPLERPSQAAQKTRRPTMDFNVVEAELRKSLNRVRTPPLSRIAEKVGVSTRSLYMQFPELTQQVSIKAKACRRAKTDQRTQRHSKIFFSAFATLVLTDEFPTSRRLATILGAGACITHREFYAALLEKYGLTGMGRAPEPTQCQALRRARDLLITSNLQMTAEAEQVLEVA
ncbi:TniQ family protein [Caballeronia grimmiae]|uniref:TniQ family protein n=1 Tax=Caballeronia grimmiae TaxID=1071679 RepID=UPI0038B8A51C